MVWWIVGAVLLAAFAGGFTILWWKLGDQWADAEYKKFGHGGGAPKGDAPEVITNFDAPTRDDAKG